MINIRPFKGLRPRKDIVDKVAAKPYDVLNSAEAKAEATNNPFSFLRISKPEINFENNIDQYAEEVYQKGKEVFTAFINENILQRDEKPCMYVYAQTMEGRTQTGLVAGSSIDDYFNDKIKKHELTLIAKENDRIKHMKTKMAQPGMVFLTYKAVEEIDVIIEHYTSHQAAENDFVDSQNVRHQLWKIDNENIIQKLVTLFKEQVPASYIADGHHRSAASAKVGKQLREENPNHTGNESYNYFLSCLFPSNQLQIQDYNRLVKDLNDLSEATLLEKIAQHFTIEKIGQTIYKPTQLHEFSMYVNGNWYKLNANKNTYNENDPIGVLDVTILSKYILDEILNIKDQRTDKRIDFVGGIRGLGELQKRVDSGEMKIAFAFYPVSLDQLIAIADTGNIMPPKSTWFEPKLKSGLVINVLND
ncbi:MAG TPA: DUF1015 family protein [Chitinophagales bacterium]|nr:DUF1015 family protein [Chitinophagales bacterium]HMW13642.1 DUF1015 family protein [Chitinophagales bacterium]HMX59636.1 DUF1015 family protein [Chitinophagales bacterium]HMZ34756.1 DUF1015 family protein [Chitinophagales bacterium]HNJ01964.1 DUF1015 family protein [Chitinophagales bacterium]